MVNGVWGEATVLNGRLGVGKVFNGFRIGKGLYNEGFEGGEGS